VKADNRAKPLFADIIFVIQKLNIKLLSASWINRTSSYTTICGDIIMKTALVVLLTLSGLSAIAGNNSAGNKNAEIISRQCKESIAAYLEIQPIFEDDKGGLLEGFGAYWNEDQYLNRTGTVSVLFSSENVIYFYNESSDVGGDVYRCDTHTGTISIPVEGYSHYPSCEGINKSIATEVNRGSVYFDYCSEHPQD
jgi:hypothetical protein